MSRFMGGGGIPADTNPPQPDNGKQWVDTSQSPPEVKIYDSATQAWLPADTKATVVSQTKPTPEVGKIWFEPAQDGTNMYAASSNKWEFLKFLPAIPDTTTSRVADNGTSSGSQKHGIAFTLSGSFSAVGFEISSNTGSGVTRAYLYNLDTSTPVTDVDITSLGAGDTFTISASYQANTEYAITLDAEGASYTYGFTGSPSYPYTGADVDIIAGVDGQSTKQSGLGYTIVSVGNA